MPTTPPNGDGTDLDRCLQLVYQSRSAINSDAGRKSVLDPPVTTSCNVSVMYL
jgi:hypothetical protein